MILRDLTEKQLRTLRSLCVKERKICLKQTKQLETDLITENWNSAFSVGLKAGLAFLSNEKPKP